MMRIPYYNIWDIKNIVYPRYAFLMSCLSDILQKDYSHLYINGKSKKSNFITSSIKNFWLSSGLFEFINT